MKEYIVSEHHEDQRVDNYLLRELRKVPKGLLYRLLRTRKIRVNGKTAKPDLRLSVGDRITTPDVITPEAQAIEHVSDTLKSHLEHAVLYQSEDYIIINKPSGLAVHGGTDQAQGLIEAMRLTFPHAQSWELAHRIDKETSGCVVIAKKRQALLHFQNALKTPDLIRKTYHVLVAGKWPKALHKVELPLLKSESWHGHVVRVDHREGKYACTTFEILETFGSMATLLAASLKTGRTHQIRVHTASQGHPILGDERYAMLKPDAKSPPPSRSMSSANTLDLPKPPRMFLHAAQIKFLDRHGETIQVNAPFDESWSHYVSTLQRLFNPRA